MILANTSDTDASPPSYQHTVMSDLAQSERLSEILNFDDFPRLPVRCSSSDVRAWESHLRALLSRHERALTHLRKFSLRVSCNRNAMNGDADCPYDPALDRELALVLRRTLTSDLETALLACSTKYRREWTKASELFDAIRAHVQMRPRQVDRIRQDELERRCRSSESQHCKLNSLPSTGIDPRDSVVGEGRPIWREEKTGMPGTRLG
ncbi:hypothetical protein V8E36_005214 [Tilletia maclaganii]